MMLRLKISRWVVYLGDVATWNPLATSAAAFEMFCISGIKTDACNTARRLVFVIVVASMHGLCCIKVGTASPVCTPIPHVYYSPLSIVRSQSYDLLLRSGTVAGS